MKSLSLALVLALITACGSVPPNSLADGAVNFLTDSAQNPARSDSFNYQGAADYSRLRRQDALLILKDGEIVFEEYQNGYGIGIPHRLNSGTKSFNCLIAVAAQQQRLFRLSQVASGVITEWKNSDKERITIEQLLNYTSGLPTAPFSIEVEDTHGEVLTPALIGRPGQYYTYGRLHSGAFSLLIERITGRDPVDYLKTTVLDPIGVKVGDWDRDTLGKPLMASGAYLTARDWGQVGQFFLQGGVWQGKRILDPLPLQQCHNRGSRAFKGYGLSFWLNEPGLNTSYDSTKEFVPPNILENGNQFAPSAPRNLYVAVGANNQFLYLLPTQNLVIVRFGQQSEWNSNEFLKILLNR